MNNVDRNILSIPALLRAIGKSDISKSNKHDIILNEAANLIEHLAAIREKVKDLLAER